MVSWTYATPNEALGFFDCIFRDQEVGGSNPLAPTTLIPLSELDLTDFISNEVRKGTFLNSFDTRRFLH